MNHDPLCRAYGVLFWPIDITGRPFDCDCGLIVRVRNQVSVDPEVLNMVHELAALRNQLAIMHAEQDRCQCHRSDVRSYDRPLVDLRAKVLAEKVDSGRGEVTGEWDAAMEKVLDFIDEALQ